MMAALKDAPVFILLVLILPLLSCARPGEPVGKPRLKTVGASVATPVPAPVNSVIPSPAPAKPTPIQLVKEEKKDGRQGELGRYKQSSPFLQYQTAASILPEDFKIGKMENLNTPDVRKQGILSVLRKFMDKFMKGEMAEDLINKDDSLKITHTLKAVFEEKTLPVRYRIAEIQDTGDPVIAIRLRFWGEKNSVEGDVYLVQSEGKWYITDIIANFARLTEDIGGNQEKFVPLGYKPEY
jgi:hypothetical protein